MSHTTHTTPAVYGLMAEFDSAAALLDAAHKTSAAGFTKTDAYSPMPIHGMGDALGFKEHLIPKFVLAAGVTGGLSAYFFEYWAGGIAYPLNIGGRAYFSWVSFIPPAYEVTILFAALTAAGSMLLLNGLPRHHHPVFNVPRFSRASQDGFFLAIEASDPKFNIEQTRAFLDQLNPREVVAFDE